MMNTRTIQLGLLGVTVFVGCDKGSPTLDPSTPPTPSINMSMPPPSTVEAHGHSSKGPHQGTLIELGKDEFHAELVHDDKSVSIYILDDAAKTAVSIEASEININLVHDGKPEQFTLGAHPDIGDPSGRSSRFVSADSDLAGRLDDESSQPKLNVIINGKGYRGLISHNHEGHDHSEHDHKH